MGSGSLSIGPGYLDKFHVCQFERELTDDFFYIAQSKFSAFFLNISQIGDALGVIHGHRLSSTRENVFTQLIFLLLQIRSCFRV